MLEIDNLIKESLKNKKATELKVYRNLKADIMAFKTQKNAPEYTQETELKIIQKYCKRLEDSIQEFSKASREDLISECQEELEVLKKHLPKPYTEDDVFGWIEGKGVFNAIPKQEMGKYIKEIKEAFPGIDGKLVADIVKSNLK